MEIEPNATFVNNLSSNQPSRCVDLIVLGINYRSNEEDVRKYFQQFGELVFCEIKRDAQGQSRGFGFVRFKDYESQLNALNKRHHIDGRTCDLKIPDSKNPGMHEPECARKVFVARLPEIVTADDLNQYFKRFGEVTDVYIPRPSRSFAFVTFLESSVVPTLYGDHFINGCSVHVGPAEPKGKPSDNQLKRSKGAVDRNFHNVRSIPPTNVYPPSYSPYNGGTNMLSNNGNLNSASAGANPDQQLLLQQMLNPNMMQAFLQAFQQQQQQQQQQHHHHQQQQHHHHQQQQQQTNKYDANNWATGMNDQTTNAYNHLAHPHHPHYPNDPTTSGKFSNDPWGPQHPTYR